jgi:hypothetical protein
MKMKVFLKKLLFISIPFLATLALLDIAYRIFIEPADVVPREIGRFDRTLGWSLMPNASGSSSRTGQKITYRINSKGLRDDETDYAKPAGTFRIVLLGDSRTFGYAVPIEKHFSKLIEGYFAHVEVINMGVSGFGVDQELLFLRSEGFRYQPDLVIAYVAHFGDQRHMYSNRWGRNKPLLSVQDGALVLTNSPVTTLYEGKDLPHQIDLFLTWHSPLYRDVSWAVSGILHKGFVAAASGPAATPDKKDVGQADFEQRMFDLAKAILRQIDRESRDHGARFLLLTEIERLHQECTQMGIESLDVSSVLQNRLYDLPNGLEHINESGNGALAWELAKFFRDSGAVPARHWKVDTDTEKTNEY